MDFALSDDQRLLLGERRKAFDRDIADPQSDEIKQLEILAPPFPKRRMAVSRCYI